MLTHATPPCYVAHYERFIANCVSELLLNFAREESLSSYILAFSVVNLGRARRGIFERKPQTRVPYYEGENSTIGVLDDIKMVAQDAQFDDGRR